MLAVPVVGELVPETARNVTRAALGQVAEQVRHVGRAETGRYVEAGACIEEELRRRETERRQVQPVLADSDVVEIARVRLLVLADGVEQRRGEPDRLTVLLLGPHLVREREDRRPP